MADSEDQGAAWMRQGMPGPQHDWLAGLAGIWDQTNEIWPFPGAPGQTFPSVSELHTIYGGRYLVQSMKGGMEMQGLMVEFEGIGHFGFDNFKQKHFFGWIDNSTTMLMYGEGEDDAAGKVTYYGKLPDPLTGGVTEFKAILWKEDDNILVFENLGKLPDGSWFLKMRAISKRRPG